MIKHQVSTPTLLIDASIYIFQYYFSLPDRWCSEENQWSTAAVYGYTSFLIRLLKNTQPQRIAACFDESLGGCFRNDIYPNYKMSRALPDQALAFQLDACKAVTKMLGIASFSSERYEADDLLGSLYVSCTHSENPVAILTRDKDLGQLLSRPQDYLWDYARYEKGLKNNAILKPSHSEEYAPHFSSVPESQLFIADIEKKFGVAPDQLIDYLALVGDAIDDIPGVPGIGAKTAVKLLQQFGDVNRLLQLLDLGQQKTMDVLSESQLRGAKRTAKNLYDHREQIVTAQALATIVTTLKLVDDVSQIHWQGADMAALKLFCAQMGFPRLVQAARSLSGNT